MKRKWITIFPVLIASVLVIGCEKGPERKMHGTYVNSNQKATLQMTADKMVVSGGPLTITADYKVVNVSGNDLTIEVTAPNTPKGNMVVTVSDDSLLIQNNFLFGGRWTRK